MNGYWAGVSRTAARWSRSTASSNSSRVGIAVSRNFNAHHPLCALHAVGLGAAVEEVGDDGAVADELAAHGGGLAVVDDLRGRAAAEVLLPRSAGQRVEIVVDQVGTQGN